MLVVIVEDDPQISTLYRDVLTVEGFEVAGPLHGPAALDDANWEAVDVAVVDLVMPDVDGQDVLEYLADRWPEVRRVVATAREQVPADARRFADVVLVKPFNADDLLVAVSGGVTSAGGAGRGRGRPTS